jgi:HAMP domain-containing protein
MTLGIVISSGADLGDVPTWILAALATAAFISFMLLFLIERGGERRARLEQSQAAKISAWYDPRATVYAEGATPGLNWLCLINSSSDPVYNCQAELMVADSVLKSMPIHIIPPLGRVQVKQVEHPGLEGIRDIAVRLRFTDAAGRRWEKNEKGNLRVVDGGAG